MTRRDLLIALPPTTKRAAAMTTMEEKPQELAFISHSPSTYPLNDPQIDDAQLARRKRRRTSPGELSVLESEFFANNKPTRQDRERIAARVNMTEKAVQVWFQNKRQQHRRNRDDPARRPRLNLPMASRSHTVVGIYNENWNAPVASKNNSVRLAMSADGKAEVVRAPLRTLSSNTVSVNSPAVPAVRFSSLPAPKDSMLQEDTEAAQCLLFLKSGQGH